MGWSIGWDTNWNRDIGYGVPAYCDHPDCNEEIDRGLSYVCGSEPHGGDRGCGLYFCSSHLLMPCSSRLPGQLCQRCYPRAKPSFAAKPDHPEWLSWKLSDSSWKRWRKENPKEVKRIRHALKEAKAGHSSSTKIGVA